MKKSVRWFRQLSITKKVLVGFAALCVLSAASGSGHQTNLNVKPAQGAASVETLTATSEQAQHTPTITTRTVTETQDIPFGIETVTSDALSKGTSKITTAGVNGSQTLTFQVTYQGDKQTDKKLINTTVTQQPVTQVTTIGTYVAPAPAPAPRTYTNVDGNQIESPDANPAGATGVCNDGTYTRAQHHQGACSSHGGVSHWL